MPLSNAANSFSSAPVPMSNACAPSSSACISSKAIKSFSAYRKWKGHQWKERVSKTTVKDKEEEVAIAIGLMEFNEKESKLKPVRGKRVMLRTSNRAPYADIRTQAEAKFTAFHSNCYKGGEEYRLLYESGKDAQFLPGTTEFFSLKRYKEEIGKDYKSIVLYLCTNEDLNASENPDTDWEESVHSEDEHGPSGKKLRLTQVESDEMLARQLQSELDNSEDPAPYEESSSGVNNEQDSVVDKSASQEIVEKFDSCSDLISCLKKRVNCNDQFFIAVRRGSSLQLYLSIWQTEANRNSPENLLRVHFAGEDGIDTGAMSKEFLTLVIEQMRSLMFPHGSPTDSMLYAHKGFFHTCAQISLVSIVQGGSPPWLFEECVYNMLINQEVDMNQLTAAQSLTKHENELLTRIANDPKGMEETILEHGYTGMITTDHLEAITGTVILSIVSKRLLYLKEFERVGPFWFPQSNAE